MDLRNAQKMQYDVTKRIYKYIKKIWRKLSRVEPEAGVLSY